MWSAAVFEPAFPGRSTIARGSPFPPAPWSAQAVIGWKPNVFFQVGAACSFSEWAITMVASRSTVTRPPSAPGASSPASAQARSRAAARAARIAFSARGPSAASVADQPGHHRVRRDRPGQVRLLPQHRDVGQAVPAQRDGGGQVRDDLARVVDRPRRPPPGQALRQAPAQAGHPHRLPQQDRPGLGHQAPAVSRHGDPGSCVRYSSPEKCL